MSLLDYERRRSGAHGVEVTATGAALGTGAGIAVERVRDRYKQDKPKTLRRIAARTGPLEHAVLHARVPPAAMAAGTLAAGVGYGAQKYQDRLTATELKNTRRRAQEARNRNQDRKRGTIAARAPQEVIEMETGILAKAANYRVERHRSQAEGATLTGGLIASGAAGHAQLSRTRHLRAAESARTGRRIGGITTTLGAGATGVGAHGAHGAYTSAASAHRSAAPAFDEAAHPFQPPPRPRGPRRRTGERTADFNRRVAEHTATHQDRVTRAEAAHTEHVGTLRAAHEAKTARGARLAGWGAVGRHAAPGAAGLLATGGGAATTAIKHGEFRRATKLAARSGRAARSRGAAALGLLGTAVALHESKNRKPPARIPYA